MLEYNLRPNPSPEATARAAAWAEANFAPSRLPISFGYGGRSSSDLIPQWTRSHEQIHSDATRTLDQITYRDPETGLEVRCEATTYLDSAAVEWVVSFRNGGSSASPILEEVQALATRFDQGDGCILQRRRGSQARRTDFAPAFGERQQARYEEGPAGERVLPNETIRFATSGGRSSNAAFPFFNLAWPGAGTIVGIGWSGQWAASVARDEGTGISVTAGMERTHLTLRPGEEIRTPRILLLFWTGEPIDGHNQLRRFLLAHHIPSQDGEPVVAPISACGWFFFDPQAHGVGVSERNQIELIDRYQELDLPIECFWIDAGWYANDGAWNRSVGNWYPNPANFPHGLRPVADAAHARGLKLIVWFEPERVYAGTRIDQEHPEWLLHLPDNPSRLFDLGNPAARAWLTNLLSETIEREGIDIYRNDFNLDPLPYWRAADAPDREGIAEIRYIEGLYACWDELRRRHPGLMIDNCASGGRRIDLETMSRSIPLTRTDYFFEPSGLQAHTWGLNHYIPISATMVTSPDPYDFRSSLGNGNLICWDPRPDNFPADLARRALEEQKRLRPYFLGDFYPLTAHSVTSDAWMAYQFDRPDLGEGIVLVFRREASPYRTATLRLNGVQADHAYEVIVEDQRQVISGSVLRAGWDLTIDDQRASRIITYRRQA